MSVYEIIVPNWGDPNLEGEATLTTWFADRKSAKQYVAGFIVKPLGKSFLVLTPKLRRVRRIREPVVYECDPAEQQAQTMRYMFRNQVLADKFLKGIKVRERKDE